MGFLSHRATVIRLLAANMLISVLLLAKVIVDSTSRWTATSLLTTQQQQQQPHSDVVGIYDTKLVSYPPLLCLFTSFNSEPRKTTVRSIRVRRNDNEK